MVNFADLRHIISAFAPNVPDFVASNAIREACRMFFRETLAHQVDVDMPFSKDIAECDIDIFESDVEFVSIVSAELDGKPLEIVSEFPRIASTGKPRIVKGSDNKTVSAYPTPDKDYDVYLRVAVRPTFNAQNIDSEVFSSNEEAIRYGALAILKSQPKTEWHSPEEVQYYQQLFKQQINQKRIDLFTLNSEVTPSVALTSFN